MQNYLLKQYISNLTGVELTTTKVAMPLLSGQSTLKNRQLTWHRFNPNDIPFHLPERMKNEVSGLINRYRVAYQQHVPAEMQKDFSSMMFAWYAEDASLTEDDFKRLFESNHPHKDKMLEVGNFIQKNGVPLAKSQIEFDKTKNSRDKEGGYNGGEVHMSNYGWAWGGKETASEDNGERRLHQLLSDKQKNDSAFIEKVYSQGKVIVQVTTAQVENGWGVFLTDGQDILPVISDAVIKKMQESGGEVSTDSTVSKAILRDFGKMPWFAHRSSNDPKAISSFRPNERRFLLETPDDPAPKAVYWFSADENSKKVISPAFDGRHRGMFEKRNKWNKRESIDPRIYTLMIRANGTLYWQNEADKKVQINATQEQVNFFNHLKGHWLVLSSPGYKKYVFDNEYNKKKYYDDCFYLNELRDFITSTSGRHHVASQSYQIILVGPRFTAGKQVGLSQAPGKLYHPEQESEDLPLEEHLGEFTGKRDEWVLEKHEYYISTFREAKMEGKFDAPTSEVGPALSDGRGHSCEEAIQKAIEKYYIPSSVLPSPQEIKAAEAAYIQAQNFYINKLHEMNPQPDLIKPVQENNTNPIENQQQNQTENIEPVKNTDTVQNTNSENLNKNSYINKDMLSYIKKLGNI